MIRTLEGCETAVQIGGEKTIRLESLALHLSRCVFAIVSVRRYRFAQPPANSSKPFGFFMEDIQNHPRSKEPRASGSSCST